MLLRYREDRFVTMMQLEDIIQTAIDNGASDIHLTVGVPPIVRVNGKLLHIGDEELVPEVTATYANQVLGTKRYEEFTETGEFDCAYTYMDAYHFRVNVFRQKEHAGIVMRTIPEHPPTLQGLRLPSIFETVSMKRRGLILVTGPTGSGKTTTLAAMIDHMTRTRNEHIITIEDPMEYVFEHGTGIVNQRTLGTDTRSFASAIRAALREDPDIIMVGEMRDLETISAAITAAETGHLVLSTLHTIGAAKTIDRIVDAFPAGQQAQVRTQLASCLEAVISQQLVPNRDGSGRALALEVMLGTHGILNMVRENKTNQIQNLMQLSKGEGMVTMDQSLLDLYRSGQIDDTMLLKYCVDPKEVKRNIGM